MRPDDPEQHDDKCMPTEDGSSPRTGLFPVGPIGSMPRPFIIG